MIVNLPPFDYDYNHSLDFNDSNSDDYQPDGYISRDRIYQDYGYGYFYGDKYDCSNNQGKSLDTNFAVLSSSTDEKQNSLVDLK